MSALSRVRELPDFDRLCEMQTREGERGPNLLNSLDVIFGWFTRLFSSRVVCGGENGVTQWKPDIRILLVIRHDIHCKLN